MNRYSDLPATVGLLALALTSGVLSACSGDLSASESSTTGAHEKEASANTSETEKPQLGVMSSLPVAWPILSTFDDIASGQASVPWIGKRLGDRFELVPVDSLATTPALGAESQDYDPLGDLAHVAVIQPRGLSPSDNVALDDWVREGGSLLLALDPQLTGHYDVAFTDPRHPSVVALIPPVVERWGLQIRFDDEQSDALRFAAVGGQPLALHRHGQIVRVDGAQSQCEIDPSAALARCAVGEGRVTLLADAAVFEHEELSGEDAGGLHALLKYAFES